MRSFVPRKRTASARPKTLSYTSPVGTVTTYKHFDEMTHDEGRVWLQGLRERLQHKMQRERDYLDRRAARGTHTPTDEAYENDQLLEAEILALLARLEHGLKEQEDNV